MGVTLSEVTGRARPRSKTVPIVLDAAAAGEIAELESRLATLRKDDDSIAAGGDEASRVADEIEVLRERAEASKTDFTLTSIGADAWADLFTKHPPSREQRSQGFDHDPDGFQVDVIAACLVEPEVDGVDSVRQLRRSILAGDWQLLFLTARQLNEVPELSVPTSAASSVNHQGWRPKPTTAAPEESPEASSLDES